MKNILLTIVILTVSSFFVSAESMFKDESPFFDRAALLEGAGKEKIKGSYCPDGSSFIALNTHINEEKAQITEATCMYSNGSLALTIEHVWTDDIKTREYSTVDHKLHGKHVERLENGLFLVSETCHGKILRTEIQAGDEVVAVEIYSEDQNKPMSVVHINEPS